MSFDVTWDINKYREEHECEEHWFLRKAFLEQWKNNYPEERLICLARVFSNIEFMGCRYPAEVMKEIASLSQEVAKSYRNQKKTKLQRTFVSASDAAEDRAKGVKREGGIIKDAPPPKSTHINFVKQGESNINDTETTIVLESDNENDINDVEAIASDIQDKQKDEKNSSSIMDPNEYLNDLLNIKCIDVRRFRENMFQTCFGRMVMLVRPWTSKLSNIKASCQACQIPLQSTYENNIFTIIVNDSILAEGEGFTKQEAKTVAEALAWDRMKTQVISLLIKEQWIAHGSARISVSEVSGKQAPSQDTFGTPIESSVASKMMQMMGWKGGGLGADAQGIAEPIKPHLQMVNRAGLGSSTSDIRQVKRAAHDLMQRYIATSSLDLDLVFSSDFSKEERAALHQCAQRAGLASKSYGRDVDRSVRSRSRNGNGAMAHDAAQLVLYNVKDRVDLYLDRGECLCLASPGRFLVVKKKLNPYSIVKAVIEEGGNTAKYQVFIPVTLSRDNW